MKIKSKIVAYLKLMHSFFVKGILITGLAISTQNVMAHKKYGNIWHKPPCNAEHCCQVHSDTIQYKSCRGKNGALATCEHVTCPCDGCHIF